jgi:hypothetical protein
MVSLSITKVVRFRFTFYCRYEALALAHGAALVTTFEYNRLQYAHPLIDTFLVNETQSNSDLAGAFDVAMSISSFEHDGLGRYGDPLNPDGDMIAMRSTRRLLKPGNLQQDMPLLHERVAESCN